MDLITIRCTIDFANGCISNLYGHTGLVYLYVFIVNISGFRIPLRGLPLHVNADSMVKNLLGKAG